MYPYLPTRIVLSKEWNVQMVPRDESLLQVSGCLKRLAVQARKLVVSFTTFNHRALRIKQHPGWRLFPLRLRRNEIDVSLPSTVSQCFLGWIRWKAGVRPSIEDPFRTHKDGALHAAYGRNIALQVVESSICDYRNVYSFLHSFLLPWNCWLLMALGLPLRMFAILFLR